MLFSRRQRLKDLQQCEAAGESLWTSKFSERARHRLLYAWQDVCGHPYTIEGVATVARGLILRDEGLLFLVNSKLSIDVDFMVSYTMHS